MHIAEVKKVQLRIGWVSLGTMGANTVFNMVFIFVDSLGPAKANFRRMIARVKLWFSTRENSRNA